MLGYETPRAAIERRRRPGLVLAIVGLHAAALLAVASAKMDLPAQLADVKTRIRWIPDPVQPPPPPPPVQNRVETPPSAPSTLDSPRPLIDPPLDRGPVVPPMPPTPPILDVRPGPLVEPVPAPPPVEVTRLAARLLTRGEAIRPPYPEAKRRLEEEAVLRLRLTVGPDGRVRSVEPVGRADPAFLESARRHIVARWRYAPASENGSPVETSITVTLRFELQQA